MAAPEPEWVHVYSSGHTHYFANLSLFRRFLRRDPRMGLNWMNIIGTAVTLLPKLVQKIQHEAPQLPGPDKKQIVTGWSQDVLQVIDGITQGDLEANPHLAAAISAGIDAEVASQNAATNIANIVNAIKAMKATNTQPAAPAADPGLPQTAVPMKPNAPTFKV